MKTSPLNESLSNFEKKELAKSKESNVSTHKIFSKINYTYFLLLTIFYEFIN